MKILKKYIVVIAIALPVLILITIKTFNAAGFKYDAKRWSIPSFNGSNLVSASDTGKLKGDKLLIILDKDSAGEFIASKNRVMIAPGDILEKQSLKLMREHKGPILLFSADPGLSARIWMIISQTGIRNIYIMTSETDNELFKSEFRPDSLKRTEFTN
jgi:hypothetical protein